MKQNNYRQQQLFAIAGFGVKLKFMFHNVVRLRGTISQQVGLDIPLRSIFKPSYARTANSQTLAVIGLAVDRLV